MPPRPLVSVIVPAYQAEDTLGAALTGALTQTYDRVEIVVCNDGSSDATSAIAHAHALGNSSTRHRVVVVDQENRGLAAARNAAIEASSGELVTLCDSDDMLLPSHVADAVEAFDRRGGGRTFVSSNAWFLSKHGIIPGRRIYTRPAAVPSEHQRMRILEGNIASIFSTFPRAMWEELGGFSSEMRLMEDYDLWARAIFAGWTLTWVERPTACYRLTPGSLSSDSARMAEYDKLLKGRLRERFGESMTPQERDRLDFMLEHDTAAQYIDAAAVELAAGRTAEAARLLGLAARLSPSDRRLRLKALALQRLPVTGRVYARREAQRLSETSR